MNRAFYRCLLRLHPRAFRLRFEDEMLWIFDEGAGAWGTWTLISDGSISLLRQRFIRSDLWKWVVAGIAGFIPLLIAFGSFLPWDRPVHP